MKTHRIDRRERGVRPPSLSRCALVAAIAAVALAAGCDGDGTGSDGGPGSSDSGTSGRYIGGSVRGTCGPADGAALQLVLWGAAGSGCESGDPSAASLSFYLYDGAQLPSGPLAAPHTYTAEDTGGLGSGSVSECPGGTPPCRTSNAFTVVFEHYDDGTFVRPTGMGTPGASGTYEIDFGGETVTGSFDVDWCEGEPIVCG